VWGYNPEWLLFKNLIKW